MDAAACVLCFLQLCNMFGNLGYKLIPILTTFFSRKTPSAKLHGDSTSFCNSEQIYPYVPFADCIGVLLLYGILFELCTRKLQEVIASSSEPLFYIFCCI